MQKSAASRAASAPPSAKVVRPIPALRKVQLLAKLYRGLSDPSRLAILDALRSGPLVVSDIITATGLSQSNVSNHLSCLYECDLVTREQQGRYVRYRLSDARVELLLRHSEELLSDTARGVIACMSFKCSNEKC